MRHGENDGFIAAKVGEVDRAEKIRVFVTLLRGN